MGMESPGPVYVPGEEAYRLACHRAGRAPESILDMARETADVRIGTGKRFLPGAGSFFTMVKATAASGSFGRRWVISFQAW